jgi:Spy/CpxP family protein refolding chaperone
MSNRFRVILGFFLALLLMVSGLVYAADGRAVVREQQLQREVRLLQMINQLNLTDEQVEKLLPALKKLQEVSAIRQSQAVEMLERYKDALIKGEKPGDVQRRMAAIRAQEMKVESETMKLQLMKILTPEQFRKLGAFLNSSQEKSPGPVTRIGRVQGSRGLTPDKFWAAKRVQLRVGRLRPIAQGNRRPVQRRLIPSARNQILDDLIKALEEKSK